jgi:divalent metal cation (Fe/Co/Zn/Cd) transporter
MECDLSHRAVNTALWCNFLVFSLKFGVWISTSSHVMLAELVHSVADFANQVSSFRFFFFFAMAVNVYTFPLCSMSKNKES